MPPNTYDNNQDRDPAIKLIAVGFALVLAMMLSLVAGAFVISGNVQWALNDMLATRQVALEQLQIMRDTTHERWFLLRQAATSSDRPLRRESVRALADLKRVLDEAMHGLLVLDLPEPERRTVEREIGYVQATLPVQERIVELAQKNELHAARRLLDEEAGPVYDRAKVGLRRLIDYELAQSEHATRGALGKVANGRILVVGTALAAFLFAVVVAVFVWRRSTALFQRLVLTSDALRKALRDLEYQKSALDQHAIVSIADASGRLVYANDKYCDISGYGREELVDRGVHLLAFDGHTEQTREEIWAYVGRGTAWRGELRSRDKSGRHYWVATTIAPFFDEGGRPYQYVSIRTEVTRIKEAERALEQSAERLEAQVKERTQALEQINRELQHEIAERRKLEDSLRELVTHDPLTGIYNRRKFDETLELEIHRAIRYRLPLSLIIFDVDRFKAVNDTHGHPVGDQVLIGLAGYVSRRIRSSDIFARLGGEEFVILALNSDAQAARALAEKLRGGIEAQAFPVAGGVTCSFGIAELRPEHKAADLLREADAAMYRAKQNGRNRVESHLAAPTPPATASRSVVGRLD